jgi:hypothetical protein
MLELNDWDLSYKGVVTANPSAPFASDVFDPSIDSAAGCTGALPDVVNDSVRVSRAGTNAVVSWTDSPGSFNVYRGSRSAAAWSYNHTCIAPTVTGPVTDSDVPPPGTAAYYLITRVTEEGESAPGEGRPNPSPCPCVGNPKLAVVSGTTMSRLRMPFCPVAPW